jgi:hypothetical protein
MAKKNIGNILSSGTLRQRLLLMFEERARGKHFQERLLTEGEASQLQNSFKKPNEIKLWNEFYDIDETVTNAIINLQGLMFEVLMRYSDLRGYILTWNSIENAELLANLILHEIKDPKERKQIAERGTKGVNLLLSKVSPDKEGYIDIDIDKKQPSLYFAISNVKKEVEDVVIKYYSWESATLDFMEETGFKIKTYRNAIKDMTKRITDSPIIDWDKYKVDPSRYLAEPRLERVMEKYAICPDIENLKPDEDQYNWFRANFLEAKEYPEELRGKLNTKLNE